MTVVIVSDFAYVNGGAAATIVAERSAHMKDSRCHAS